MGRPARRRLPPERRRLEIIEAAERLLQAGGARVRVEDVVREAGVAKGTFFLYFPGWDDLLEAIRDRLGAAFDASCPALPTTGDWLALIEAQALGFIAFTLPRRGLGEAIFHSDFAQRRPPRAHFGDRLGALIRAGQAAGALGPVDAARTARLLFAAIHEAADAVAADPAARSEIEAALLQIIRRALAP